LFPFRNWNSFTQVLDVSYIGLKLNSINALATEKQLKKKAIKTTTNVSHLIRAIVELVGVKSSCIGQSC
jgi:hypothetical protein